MKKYVKLLSLILVLFIGITLFTGCDNSNDNHSVIFMTAQTITYSELSGVQCIYVSTNGDTVFINDGEVIGSAPIGTQYGAGNLYSFVGWFTERECINSWDLYRDEVKCNLVLYPKYVRV